MDIEGIDRELDWLMFKIFCQQNDMSLIPLSDTTEAKSLMKEAKNENN